MARLPNCGSVSAGRRKFCDSTLALPISPDVHAYMYIFASHYRDILLHRIAPAFPFDPPVLRLLSLEAVHGPAKRASLTEEPTKSRAGVGVDELFRHEALVVRKNVHAMVAFIRISTSPVSSGNIRNADQREHGNLPSCDTVLSPPTRLPPRLRKSFHNMAKVENPPASQVPLPTYRNSFLLRTISAMWRLPK